MEIKDVIDVINGNAIIKPHPGKASGVYISDVSSFTIGFILGGEWEPKGVTYTNQNVDINKYSGDFISLPKGSPMEVWLAEMMDYTVKYEVVKYHKEHQVNSINQFYLGDQFQNQL